MFSINRRFQLFHPYLCGVMAFVFATTSIGSSYAEQVLNLPQPGQKVALSPAFTPAYLQGMVIDPQEPFRLDFIVNRGDSRLTADEKKTEYDRLIKYFLASLAIPDADQWVNLSPYEKDRIIADNFGLTEMGRDLLAQDYILKQMSASLTDPLSDLGKIFWNKVYERAYEKMGTTDIPLETFNKVWIVPDHAEIYERGQAVYVLEHHLKVMTEKDYLASRESGVDISGEKSPVAEISSESIKEVIIPILEKEVNEGHAFAALRQAYSGMLLAAWYKRTLRSSILSQVYGDRSKVKGVDQDPRTNQEIYAQYVEAFKKGVFNLIQEDVDRYTQELIPRKYFSGGINSAAGIFDVPGRLKRRSSLPPERAMLAAQTTDRVSVRLVQWAKGLVQKIAEGSRKGQKDVRANIRKDPLLMKFLGAIKKVEKVHGPGAVLLMGGVPRGAVMGETLKEGGDIDIVIRVDQKTDEGFQKALDISRMLQEELGVWNEGVGDDSLFQDGGGNFLWDGVLVELIGLYNPESYEIYARAGLQRFIGNIQISFNTMMIDSDGRLIDVNQGAKDLPQKGRVNDHPGMIRFVGKDIQKALNIQTILSALRFKYQYDAEFSPETLDLIQGFFQGRFENDDLRNNRAWLQGAQLTRQYRELRRQKRWDEAYQVARELLYWVWRFRTPASQDLEDDPKDFPENPGYREAIQETHKEEAEWRNNGVLPRKYFDAVDRQFLSDIEAAALEGHIFAETHDREVAAARMEAWIKNLKDVVDRERCLKIYEKAKIQKQDILELPFVFFEFFMGDGFWPQGMDVVVRFDATKAESRHGSDIFAWGAMAWDIVKRAKDPVAAVKEMEKIGVAPYLEASGIDLQSFVKQRQDMLALEGTSTRVGDAPEKAQGYGGIDFAQSNLDLEIRRDGNGMVLPVNGQDLDRIQIDGLVPVILDIQPGTNVPLWSGFDRAVPQGA